MVKGKREKGVFNALEKRYISLSWRNSVFPHYKEAVEKEAVEDLLRFESRLA